MKLLILSFCSYTYGQQWKTFYSEEMAVENGTCFLFFSFFVNLVVIWPTLARKSTRSTEARIGFIKREEGFAGWWHSRRNLAVFQTKKSSRRCKNATSTQLHGHFGEKFGDATGLHMFEAPHQKLPDVLKCDWMDLVLGYRPACSISVRLKVSLPASQLKTQSEIAVWSDLLKGKYCLTEVTLAR